MRTSGSGPRAPGPSRWLLPWLLASVALLCCAAASPAAEGDEKAAGDAPAEAPAAQEVAKAPGGDQPLGPADPFNRGTPRGTVYGFEKAAREGDFARATEYLDLRRLTPEQREEAPRLARELRVVLDRTVDLDPDAFSATNDGATGDGLPSWRDLLAVVETSSGPVQLFLQRVPREGDDVRIWKVAAATVEQIPELYGEFGYGPLEEWLPQPFFDLSFLQLALWQWCALVILVLVAWIVSLVLSTVVIRILHTVASRTENTLDDRIVHLVQGPVRLAMGVGVFAAGHTPLGLTIRASEWLRGMEKVLVIVSVAWLVMRLTDLAALVIRQRLISQGDAGAVSVLTPGARVVKVLVLALAFLAALSSAGVNVTAAIAGLGVGGIAVALAAQKTIENLFGGITLFADRPVHVGDFCRFGDQVGTVEEIGLRSTRIRTLDRTLVTIPNAEFSQLYLENFAARDQIRLYATIGVRYETTGEQLRYLLAQLRSMLLAHPKISPDPARVRFVGFGAYSLDLELFAYARTSDWNEFLTIREDVFLRIIDIVEEAGTGFAFPSQTMYVGRDDGLDAQRGSHAEEAVRAWREKGELPFPNFSEAYRQEITDTLAWPPEGSSGARRGEPRGTDE